MIDLEASIQRIQEMSGPELRVALSILMGWKVSDPPKDRDANGNLIGVDPADGALDVLPHYDTNMTAAFTLVRQYGLALIPQSNEKGGFDWLAVDLKAVHYQGDIVLEAQDYGGYSHPDACIAICKEALAVELYQSWLEEQPEAEPVVTVEPPSPPPWVALPEDVEQVFDQVFIELAGLEPDEEIDVDDYNREQIQELLEKNTRVAQSCRERMTGLRERMLKVLGQIHDDRDQSS